MMITTSLFFNCAYSSLNSSWLFELLCTYFLLSIIPKLSGHHGLPFQYSCYEIEENSQHPAYDSDHLSSASILNTNQNVFFDNINNYKCFCCSDFWVSFIKCFKYLCIPHHTRILNETINFVHVCQFQVVVLGETLLLSIHLLNSSFLL